MRHVIVDGTSIPVYRIKSVPLDLLNISDENNNGMMGVETYAVADGHQVYSKPLHEGNHRKYFHGSCSIGNTVLQMLMPYQSDRTLFVVIRLLNCIAIR